MERFKVQKDRDLREAMISYAVMQISMCKKVGYHGVTGHVVLGLLENMIANVSP